MSDTIVIVGAARTPMGGFQGDFQNTPAPELGSAAIKAAVDAAGISADKVDEVLMGCVLPAGLGQAPARQAALGAGLPQSVPCTTVNKVCGSGMKTIMTAHDQLKAGSQDIMVAGGMENMSLAPYLSVKTRGGARLGHVEMKDHMFLDGLEDAYDKGSLMGHFAELCAKEHQFTREAQDDYALTSLSNAIEAEKTGAFDGEIAAFTVKTRKGNIVIDADEQPSKARPDKIPTLRPAFDKDGTVTAANASSISDGAAAVVMMSEDKAQELNTPIKARIVGHASHAHEPEWFTTAPVPAAQKLMEKIGWSVDDVDLWEVNEAFAVVPMAFMQKLGISRDKINVNGGACALGHPIGASGTRIVVTLLNALEKRGLKRGIAAICIGGGEGTAIAVERA
ncbi:acetyl-CoA C-acyltransferase [Amylibacter sp. SFDW26]|uniref:thiolase family protein n=1 Tax=Amylibacter sp. SFDW26 TaxID=2652722 RepID=UPI001261A3BA|nr:acetyl-CoA C-acyltransferase [Amylibacter sp. SFDW26]KAB7613853.1 acetyl-CoA C-acyltransferase [Amylibacter sp. SFDW26]